MLINQDGAAMGVCVEIHVEYFTLSGNAKVSDRWSINSAHFVAARFIAQLEMQSMFVLQELKGLAAWPLAE
ncbi:hypothetical protein [Pantoea sp. y20]